MGAEKWLTSADQLIQFINFISATAALGSETNKIPMGFQSYFNKFVEKHVSDPKLREQLRKIPADIQPELDPEGNKKIRLQVYRAAIIRLILNELTQHHTEQFFMSKKIEDNEARLKTLLKELRIEEGDRIAAQDYVKAMMAQNRELELMAVVALSLSMREINNRIDFLEKSRYKIFNAFVDEFYTSLEEGDTFNVLNDIKDRQGNTVFSDKTEQKAMISSVLVRYTNDFVDYCSQQNSIPFNEASGNHHTKLLIQEPSLPAYHYQNNDLFEKFHREKPNRFHSIISDSLGEKNIDVKEYDTCVKTLGAKMSERMTAPDQKKRIVELAAKSIEINNARANLEEMKANLARKKQMRAQNQ